MRKGFTLVELLAVITILSIIMLITVPIVAGIIKDSKESSRKKSVELYGRAIEQAIANYFAKYPEEDSVTFEKLQEEKMIEYNGSEISCEVVQIVERNVYLSNCTVGGKSVDATYGIPVTVSELQETEPEGTMPSSTYITFTFNGTTYEAEEGMTWEEFVDSGYNTLGWTYNSSNLYVYVSQIAGLADYATENYVNKSDIIKNGGEYYTFCCFDPGTQVLMSDGTTKNIEDIKVGEYVMSYNETTHEFEPKKVLKTITKHHSDDLVYINLSNGERIGMRAYHPLLTTEGYKSLRPEMAETVMEAGQVDKLKVGDILVGYSSNVTITSIETRPTIENYDTYNLEIEDNHNYIVNGVVAHNAGCASLPNPIK